MKKIFLTLIAITLTASVFSQVTAPDTTKKEYKNVVALDATGLLRQFINNNGNYPYYSSPFIISYKRLFRSNALRIGAGGDFYNDNALTNDTLEEKTVSNMINLGIGFEHYSYISQRWNIFFGTDAIMKYKRNVRESSRTATTSSENTEREYDYGVSPLLGVQFKINSRLSISTETSYDITFSTTTSTQTETPASIYDKKTKSTRMQTSFHPPIGLNFRICF